MCFIACSQHSWASVRDASPTTGLHCTVRILSLIGYILNKMDRAHLEDYLLSSVVIFHLGKVSS